MFKKIFFILFLMSNIVFAQQCFNYKVVDFDNLLVEIDTIDNTKINVGAGEAYYGYVSVSWNAVTNENIISLNNFERAFLLVDVSSNVIQVTENIFDDSYTSCGAFLGIIIRYNNENILKKWDGIIR